MAFDPNQLAQTLVQKGGYNPTDAANAAKGPRANELAQEFLGVSSAGPTSSSPASPVDYNAIVNQQLDLQKQANQPAIQSLQSSIPEIQAKYQQQRDTLQATTEPLKQRYQNLLDKLSARETADTKQVSLNTAQEYGRRGISLSSGDYANALQAKLLPYQQYYTGQIKDTGISQEQDLANIAAQIAALTPQETADVRSVNNAIAQLQSGGATNAINNALNVYQLNNQAVQAQQNRDLQLKQLEASLQQNAVENAIKQQTLQAQIPVNQAQANYYNAQAAKDRAATVTGGDISQYLKLLSPSLNFSPVSGVIQNQRSPLANFDK